MFSRAKSTPSAPSEAQARDKLVIYVYEYLTHMGAKNAADSFLTEINWSKGQITSNDPPGFLYSWWCVFWDLYCAAPERRDNPQFQSASSKEAISFHEYQAGVPPAGYGPLSPGHNGMAMPPIPPHHSQNMGDGGSGLASSPQMGAPGSEGPLPPGFFPGSHLRPGSQMMGHGGMMHPPSNMQPQHHPGQGGQGPLPGSGQSSHPNQGQPGGPPGHMPNGPGNPNSPHPSMGMMMQGPPGQVPFMGGPRGPFPGQGSNRNSPATRMGHPGQQQMDFGPPPGSMMMSDGAMVMSRGGMGRSGMPSSPMPMPPGGGGGGGGGGGYGGPPPGMQRLNNPGGSPSNSVLLPPMHQQQSQRQPWQHPGVMGHYSTPSPPNGNYMSMMGPPSHMQSPSHESVLSGGSDNMYGMMKGPDRFTHNMGDPSMNPLAAVHEMAASINGEGMELKHSPGLNGVENSGGRNNGSNMDGVDDPYSINQFSSAASASGTSSE